MLTVSKAGIHRIGAGEKALEETYSPFTRER